MCISKKVVIALSGHSASGKTYLADFIANNLNIPVRHCGEVLKEYAKNKSINFQSLSNADHIAIDQETVAWIKDVDSLALVVEGRFLRNFLEPCQEFYVYHFEVIAPPPTRVKRFLARNTLNSINESDAQDNDFILTHYNNLQLSSQILRSEVEKDLHVALDLIKDIVFR